MIRLPAKRVALLAAIVAIVYCLPAGVGGDARAVERWFSVRLADGNVVVVQVDVLPDTPPDQIMLPGELIEEVERPAKARDEEDGEPRVSGGARADGEEGPADEETGEPRTRGRRGQRRSGSRRAARSDAEKRKARVEAERRRAAAKHRRVAAAERRRRARLRRPDGAPAPTNPTYFDALPGPTTSSAVPNFVISKFRVPIFLLPIYQAAGTQYGIRWEYLAAINEIETDYGRNLNVSSAGALGWMQFMPATWRAYGVDANRDGRKDPYNPVDAIFAAARYLKAAGAPGDMRGALFAYNHADWYVDSVVLRARLIAGIPGDLVGSLTGLTDGRFPISARTRYADDLAERRGRGRGIDLFARRGAPAVAVADGVVKKIARDRRGRGVVVLQDGYGNRFTYRDLGSLARHYPLPKGAPERAEPRRVRRTTAPATGVIGDALFPIAALASRPLLPIGDLASSVAPVDGLPVRRPPAAKQRLFAHPARPGARPHGGEDQLLAAGDPTAYTTYRNQFTGTLSLEAGDVELRRLRRGSRVLAGTILGRVGASRGRRAPHLRFEIRPAGRGAPSIDPKPILDGWKLLESTAVYRASGRNVLHGDGVGASIGQIMLLPKPLLERRVLADSRIDVYPCGRRDIRTGQIDRRVLATLVFLAEAGLRPTATSLKCGHSYYTSSGNVSHHSSGHAVDIARVNGVPVLGHQEPGGVTDQTVRRLMTLQGTTRPDQIISLLDLGANTYAMGDHADHVHVGWRPLYGENRRLGRQALAVLRPRQWHDLIGRLRGVDQPRVPTAPSRWALPVRSHRASRSHRGD